MSRTVRFQRRRCESGRGRMKLIALLLIMLVACGAACPTEEPSGQPVLEIDPSGLYPGMDTTYSEGYSPSIADGTVHIVLPLVGTRPVRDNVIRVEIVWPESAQAAFVVRNYDFQVRAEKTLDDAEENAQPVFLVTLDLQLRPDPQAGMWPIGIRTSGWAEGSWFDQQFMVGVQLLEESPAETPTPDPAGDSGMDEMEVPDMGSGDTSPSGSGGEEPKPTETPAPEPRLMLTSFITDPDPVTAGGPFQLRAFMQNMDPKQTIRNVRVELEPAGGILYTDGSALAFYYPQIGPGESVELAATLMSNEVDAPSVQQITVSGSYEGKDAQDYSAEDQMLINLLPTARLEWDPPEIPEVLHAGDTLGVHIQAMNYGRSTLYNVAASIEGDGLQPEGTLYMGTLEAGSAQEGDLYAFVSPLDGSTAGAAETRYGQTTGRVVLRAETGTGAVIEYESPFEAEIEPAVLPSASASEEPEDSAAAGPNGVLITALAGAAAAVGAVVLTRRVDQRKYQRQKRS